MPSFYKYLLKIRGSWRTRSFGFEGPGVQIREALSSQYCCWQGLRAPMAGAHPAHTQEQYFRRATRSPPSGFLPPNAGILFGDDSPGPAHSRGRGRIILHTGGVWRIPPGAYPSNHKSSVTTPGRVATYYEGLRSTTKYESTTKNYKVLRSTTKYYKVP